MSGLVVGTALIDMYSTMCHPASQLYDDYSQCTAIREENHSSYLKNNFRETVPSAKDN